ncbi:hypothetical protein KFL_013100010 [Klebsormidium nitens]|uniref:Uncharacterized protein n=1 Tax=Klebsormidium nitens TaxID=105231 RepID=A0A1Y1IU64_KLENI|nr:hypothetical protein KFL_013100010 [Klebsormidium nitens]|eukprot:GAQ93119.1 hypothetical protein KFL_013100010 [Klebsormidium nitens]
MRPQGTAATTELPKRKKKNRPDPGPDTLGGPEPILAVPSPPHEASPQPAPPPLRRERKRDRAQPPPAPQEQSPPPVTDAEALNELRERKKAHRRQRLTTEDAGGSLPLKKQKGGHYVRQDKTRLRKHPEKGGQDVRQTLKKLRRPGPAKTTELANMNPEEGPVARQPPAPASPEKSSSDGNGSNSSEPQVLAHRSKPTDPYDLDLSRRRRRRMTSEPSGFS